MYGGNYGNCRFFNLIYIFMIPRSFLMKLKLTENTISPLSSQISLGPVTVS